MKKLIAFFIIASTLLLFTACSHKQENISEELEKKEENSISVNSIEKQDEAVNPKENNSTTDNENEPENISQQEKILTTEEINEIAKTMNKIEIKNIVTKLNEDQQIKFQELLHIEDWEKQELPQRGVLLNALIRNDNELMMVFFDGNSVVITTQKKDVYSCYIASQEEVKQIVEFALKVTNEGIKDNVDLINQLHGFNGLIIGEPTELYDIKEENIYTFSEEELKELHELLKVEQWKMYTGSESVYSDENVPITLHKLLDGDDMLLQVKQYGELYIAKSRSYAGPTGQDYIFEISEDIYLNLINFKDNIVK